MDQVVTPKLREVTFYFKKEVLRPFPEVVQTKVVDPMGPDVNLDDHGMKLMKTFNSSDMDAKYTYTGYTMF